VGPSSCTVLGMDECPHVITCRYRESTGSDEYVLVYLGVGYSLYVGCSLCTKRFVLPTTWRGTHDQVDRIPTWLR